MKKWFLIFIISCLASGCSKAADTKMTDEAAVEETVTGSSAAAAEEKQLNPIKIEGGVLKAAPEGMTLYSSISFQYDETVWGLELYTTADTDDRGNAAFDDNNRFLIKVLSGNDEYIIFDDHVQLGIPEADIFITQDNQLHIFVKDARTARFLLINYVYDGENKCFLGTKTVDYNGINYYGQIGPDRQETALSPYSDVENICALIKKIDGNIIELDRVEYITDEDSDRLKELNLTEHDLPDGYYIYNPDHETETLSLSPDTMYTFIDWGRDFIDSDEFEDLYISTTSKALFVKYISTYKNSQPGMPFFLEIQDGKVKTICEKPMA